MQSYKKWESRKLQKKVLQTLVLASMAYVCIIGGGQFRLGAGL